MHYFSIALQIVMHVSFHLCFISISSSSRINLIVQKQMKGANTYVDRSVCIALETLSPPQCT